RCRPVRVVVALAPLGGRDDPRRVLRHSRDLAVPPGPVSLGRAPLAGPGLGSRSDRPGASPETANPRIRPRGAAGDRFRAVRGARVDRWVVARGRPGNLGELQRAVTMASDAAA